MKTKIKNALVVKDFESPVFYGDIVVKNGAIVFVGENYVGDFEEEIDAKQNIVMPGFVDAHTHASMTLLKGVAGGKKLEDWLYEMQKREVKLKGNDVYNGALLASLEFAKNGITTINDNFHFPDYSAKAFDEVGIRAVVGLGQRYSLKKFLSEKELEKLYNDLSNKYENIRFNFYCHSVYNADANMFDVMNRLAKKYDVSVSTHASETLDEVGKCASQNDDMSPIALLESYGFFDRNAIVYHATNVDQNDLQILARYNANVCANFGSNHKLASGIAPIYQMKKYGINVCLGTDGSASNNRLDMFREMYLAVTSQNILLSNANCLSAKEVLKMATVNGAKALGYDNLGKLETGYLADLIMLDANSLNNTPCYDLFENIVYSFGTEDILMTMVNGKVIYKNGKYALKKSQKGIYKQVRTLQEKFE